MRSNTLAILTLATFANLVHAQTFTKYSVTSMSPPVDLGSLGGPFGVSEANDINDLGDVVGWSWDYNAIQRAMIYLNGQMYALDNAYPGHWASAESINNNQVVVGSYSLAQSLDSSVHGFYYYPGIWMSEIESNGHGLNFDWLTRAMSINNLDIIVGTGKIVDPPGLPDPPNTTGICYTDWLPMYWYGAGQNPYALFCYPDPDQNNSGYVGVKPAAREINDSGHIVGTDGGKTALGMFLKRGSQNPVGVPRPATSPPGMFGSANSISNTGQIVGAYGYDSGGYATSSLRAFTWNGTAEFSTLIGPFSGGSWSIANGVNDQRMVAGTSERNHYFSGLGESAFIYHPDFGMLRLPSPGEGELVTAIRRCRANAINNRKSNGLVQVVGACSIPGMDWHAVRWDIQVAQVPRILNL